MTCTKFTAPRWWQTVTHWEQISTQPPPNYAKHHDPHRKDVIFMPSIRRDQDMKQLVLFAENVRQHSGLLAN